MKLSRKMMTIPNKMVNMARLERVGTHMRRRLNALAHVLTPHGKQLAGRKGRKG